MAVIFSPILGSVQQALMALGWLKISSMRKLNSEFTCRKTSDEGGSIAVKVLRGLL